MVWAAVGYTMCPIWVIDSIHAEGCADFPFGSECAPGYYTCASCCDQDADCSCDGHGGDAHEHDWRTPKCPEGYYECRDCCDRDADCGCDEHCDWGANADCSLAYDGDAKPAGWCPVGYHDCGHRDCCDWNDDCACDGAWRTGNDDEHCGVGPTGHDGALPDFECSVRKGDDADDVFVDNIACGETRHESTTGTAHWVSGNDAPDHFYLITPSETAYYHFSTCGSDYDTMLYLYDVVDLSLIHI